MKQQLKAIKESPLGEGSDKSTGRLSSEKRGVGCASGSTGRSKETLRTRVHQSSSRIEHYTSDKQESC
eukprot:6792455-Prorocentrum_lima.AAC.1